MITQYKHTFTSETETKNVKIVVTSKDCDKDCGYSWKASGSSYNGGSIIKSGESGDEISFSNSNMLSCTSVWEVWCEEVPDFRVNIILEKYGCIILDSTSLLGGDGSEGGFGGIDDALQAELDKYKDFIDEKYSELDDKVNEITQIVEDDLAYAQEKATEIYNNAVEAQQEAQAKIEEAQGKIEDAAALLNSISENQLDVETLADGLGTSATFLNKVSGFVSNMVDAIVPDIGGFIQSAQTINTLLSSVTTYEDVVDTVNGIIDTQLEWISVPDGTVRNLENLWDAVNGSISTSIQTVSGGIVSDVKEQLESGAWSVSASVTNLEASAVTFGDRGLDLWLGEIKDELYVVNADGTINGTKHLMTSGEVMTLVEARDESGNTSYSAIRQELSAITSVVKGSDGTYSGIMQEDNNILIAVNYPNGNRAGINLGSLDGEGEETSIILDADRVVIPGDMLVGAMSANTISLGSDRSKFYGDGSGYLANGNILWFTNGDMRLGAPKNSIQENDSDGSSHGLNLSEMIKNPSWSSSFNADGSGYLAHSGITWTSDGEMTINNNVTVNANSINLNGYASINDGFSIDLEGNLKAKGGKFSGFIQSEPFIVGGFNIDDVAYYKNVDGYHLRLEELSPYIYFIDVGNDFWWGSTLTKAISSNNLGPRGTIYLDLPFQASYTVNMRQFTPNTPYAENEFPMHMRSSNIGSISSPHYLSDLYSLGSWLTYYDAAKWSGGTSSSNYNAIEKTPIEVSRFYESVNGEDSLVNKVFKYDLLDKFVGCEIVIRLSNRSDIQVMGTELCPDKYFSLFNSSIWLIQGDLKPNGTTQEGDMRIGYPTLGEYNYVHLKLVRRKVSEGMSSKTYVKKFSFPQGYITNVVEANNTKKTHSNKITFVCDTNFESDEIKYEYVWVIDYESRDDTNVYKANSIVTRNDLNTYLDKYGVGTINCLRSTVTEPYYTKLLELFTNIKPRVVISNSSSNKSKPYYVFNRYSLKEIRNEFNILKQKYETLLKRFSKEETSTMVKYFEKVEILIDDLFKWCDEYSDSFLTPRTLFEYSSIYKDNFSIENGLHRLSKSFMDDNEVSLRVDVHGKTPYLGEDGVYTEELENSDDGEGSTTILDFEDYFYMFFLPFYYEYIKLSYNDF